VAVGEEEALGVAVGLDAPNVVEVPPHPTSVKANETAMIRAARLVTWDVFMFSSIQTPPAV